MSNRLQLFLPSDLSLPFFAYGLFKKGEPSYLQIESFVERIDDVEIPGSLRIRDGLAIYTKNESDHYSVLGQVLHFKKNQQIAAYEKISSFEPDIYYKWDVNKIVGKGSVNLLAKNNGKNIGSVRYVEALSNSDGNIQEYGMKQDGFFQNFFEFYPKSLESYRGSTEGEQLLHHQMHYLLLWAAWERFLMLCYGLSKNVSSNLKKRDGFLTDTHFTSYLPPYPEDKDSDHSREILDPLFQSIRGMKVVGSAFHLEEVSEDDPLDETNWMKILYRLRSNITHQAKAAVVDLGKVERADNFLFQLLLVIFRDKKWLVENRNHRMS